MKENEQNIKIEKYKNSYNPSYFKDVISPNKINGFENPFYYPDVINSWFDFSLKELIENEYLKDRANLLTSYLQDLSYLMNCTIELYKPIDRYDVTKREMINRISIKEYDVLGVLKSIKNYKTSINLNKEKGNIDLSNKIKKYCLFKLDECILLLEDRFKINIYDSPLKTEFKKVKKLFTLNEFELLNKKHQEKESHSVRITKHDNIFSNNGYTLFEFILENHISEKRGRYSDLSYYYRKLYEDKYIHQRPVPFQEWFMDKYDESFTKIKTLEEVKGTDRKKHYSHSLNWFKQ